MNTHIAADSDPPRIHCQVSKGGQPPPFDPFSRVQCATGISFEYDGTKIKTFTITLDEASDWFLVRPGDIFSVATINAGLFPTISNVIPPLVPPPQDGVVVGPGEFYLGVRTGSGFAEVRPFLLTRTTYGWVHLRPVNGLLTMVENVMSYNSRGIIVGTTTVVPEPSAIALVGFGISLLAVFGRRARVA